jgi:hypothetical protein
MPTTVMSGMEQPGFTVSTSRFTMDRKEKNSFTPWGPQNENHT